MCVLSYFFQRIYKRIGHLLSSASGLFQGGLLPSFQGALFFPSFQGARKGEPGISRLHRARHRDSGFCPFGQPRNDEVWRSFGQPRNDEVWRGFGQPWNRPEADVNGKPIFIPSRRLTRGTGTIFIFIFISIFIPIPSQAQTTLTLDDCIQKAKLQSPAARIAHLDLTAQSHDYDAFKAGFLPQTTLSANIPGLTRSISSITQDDGKILFVPQAQTFSSMSLQVSQPIAVTGGEVFAFTSLFNSFDLNNADNVIWQSSPFVLGVRQPLFRLNTMKWDRRQESMSFQVAKINYTQALETAARDAMEIYFDALVAQIQFQIAENNVSNNDTIFQISQGRFTVGKIAENDLLQSEMNLLNARTSFESATLTHSQAIRRLKIALAIPASEEVILVLPDKIPMIESDPEFAVSQALKYSSLLQAMEMRKLRAERNVVEARQNNRLSADLTATFGLNQTADNFGDAYKNPVDRETFSIGLDVPILQWGRGRARVQAAELRQEQAQLEMDTQKKTFENEIAFQVLNLKQLAIQLARTARGDTIAQRRYAVTKSRYLVGKVDIQALFNSQREKDDARRAYASTLSRYWLALARLRENTLYDFVGMEPLGE